MDLVYKQDVVLIEVRQQRCQIPGLFNGRAGGDADIDAHFLGNDAGQRGFSQARRAVEQHVIQRFRAAAGGFNEDRQVLLGLLLPDVLRQCVGTQGCLAGVLSEERLGDNRLLVDVCAEVDAHAVPSPTLPFSSATAG